MRSICDRPWLTRCNRCTHRCRCHAVLRQRADGDSATFEASVGEPVTKVGVVGRQGSAEQGAQHGCSHGGVAGLIELCACVQGGSADQRVQQRQSCQ
eukprot:scaffold46412_cov18-Tisochrysis_lutea.AAC.1